MKCPDCANYNRAMGSKACLQCPQYRDIIKQSGKRKTIAIDVIPDIMLEAIPDNSNITLKDAIKSLPLEISIPLLMRYTLDCSIKDIAKYHKYSSPTVTRKIKIAIEIIKKMNVSEQ